MTLRPILAAALLLGLAMTTPGCGRATSAPAEPPDCCAKAASPVESGPVAGELAMDRINLPAAHLVDQEGRPVESVRDLIGGRVAAIQFIFTRCATTCPILANQFEGVRARLGDGMGRDFALISITVNPENDRPATLKDWGRRYGEGPGRSLLTGPQAEVEPAPRGPRDVVGRSEESPVAGARRRTASPGKGCGPAGSPLRTNWPRSSAGSDRRGHRSCRAPASRWPSRPRSRRRPGTMPRNATSRTPRSSTTTAVRDDFYRDLLHGKQVAVINVFFSQCNGSCVVMGNTMARLQDRLGDRLERDVRLISITVNSPHDTVDVLSAYAADTARGKAGISWAARSRT